MCLCQKANLKNKVTLAQRSRLYTRHVPFTFSHQVLQQRTGASKTANICAKLPEFLQRPGDDSGRLQSCVSKSIDFIQTLTGRSAAAIRDGV